MLRLSSNNRNIRKLEQNSRMSTLRCVLLMYDELLHIRKLPSLRMRWFQAIAVIMYKVEDGLVAPYITDLFIVTNWQYYPLKF